MECIRDTIDVVGVNSRLDSVQAAVLRAKLYLIFTMREEKKPQ